MRRNVPLPAPTDKSTAWAHVFPNMTFVSGYGSSLIYRSRPDGNNPNVCIYDFWSVEIPPDRDRVAQAGSGDRRVLRAFVHRPAGQRQHRTPASRSSFPWLSGEPFGDLLREKHHAVPPSPRSGPGGVPSRPRPLAYPRSFPARSSRRRPNATTIREPRERSSPGSASVPSQDGRLGHSIRPVHVHDPARQRDEPSLRDDDVLAAIECDDPGSTDVVQDLVMRVGMRPDPCPRLVEQCSDVDLSSVPIFCEMAWLHAFPAKIGPSTLRHELTVAERHYWGCVHW